MNPIPLFIIRTHIYIVVQHFQFCIIKYYKNTKNIYCIYIYSFILFSLS
jgi:hypothetical protein